MKTNYATECIYWPRKFKLQIFLVIDREESYNSTWLSTEFY